MCEVSKFNTADKLQAAALFIINGLIKGKYSCHHDNASKFLCVVTQNYRAARDANTFNNLQISTRTANITEKILQPASGRRHLRK